MCDREILLDRLDEVVCSPHYSSSLEPMVPILRQMCANFLWLLKGDEKNQQECEKSASELQSLLLMKPKRVTDTDRIVYVLGEAFRVHLEDFGKQQQKQPVKRVRSIISNGPSTSFGESTPKTIRAAPEPASPPRMNLGVMVKEEHPPVELIRVLNNSIQQHNPDRTPPSMNGSSSAFLKLFGQESMEDDEMDMTDTADAFERNGSPDDDKAYADLLKDVDLDEVEAAVFNANLQPEPPIYSPSVSTIRKNTKRTKPEKLAEKGRCRLNRDPDAPRQVISAYLCFVGEMRAKRNAQKMRMPGTEFSALLKSEWSGMKDKTKYEMQHEEDKRRYESEMIEWAKAQGKPIPGKKAYSFYMIEHYSQVKNRMPDASEEEVMTEIFSNWRDTRDKSRWLRMQQKDRERFKSESKMYAFRHQNMLPAELSMASLAAFPALQEQLNLLQKA